MTIALYVVLGLSALIDLVLGTWASAFWGSFTSTWHLDFAGLAHQAWRDTRLLGLVLGFCLFCFTALQILAGVWIHAEKEEGHRLAVLFGAYLVVSSIVTFLVFRRLDFLLVDGLRGAVLGVLALAALNAPATVRELRLPERSGRERERRRGERGPSRPRSEAAESGRRERGAGHPSRTRLLLEEERRRGRRGRGRRGEERERRRERGEERGRTGSRFRDEARDRLRPPPPTAVPSSEPAGAEPLREPEPEARRVGESERHEAGRTRPRRIENRSRSAEELISANPAPRRRGPSDETEIPLTVVVRGAPEDLRPRSAVETEIPVERAPSPEEDRLPITGERRRRHRRRHGRAGRGLEDRSGEPPSEEESEEGERMPETAAEQPVEEPAPEPRRARSSGYVEALDMLSLLEPSSQTETGEPQPFGRTHRPVVRRRHGAGSEHPHDTGGQPRAGQPRNPGNEPESSHENGTNAAPGPRPGSADRHSIGPLWPSDPIRENEDENAGRQGEES